MSLGCVAGNGVPRPHLAIFPLFWLLLSPCSTPASPLGYRKEWKSTSPLVPPHPFGWQKNRSFPLLLYLWVCVPTSSTFYPVLSLNHQAEERGCAQADRVTFFLVHLGWRLEKAILLYSSMVVPESSIRDWVPVVVGTVDRWCKDRKCPEDFAFVLLLCRKVFANAMGCFAHNCIYMLLLVRVSILPIFLFSH